MDQKIFDVIIIGGSYAGLSAAMCLGRSLRSILIIDAGDPCNLQAAHAHNFLPIDGENPQTILEQAKTNVLRYESVRYISDFVKDVGKEKLFFKVDTSSGNTFSARKILFATGIKDIIPDIKGFSACWGKTAVQCPYCHGYEFRDKKTAILADDATVVHQIPLLYNLSKNITILSSRNEDFGITKRKKIEQRGIHIIETELVELEHKNGKLKNLIFKDGRKEPFDILYSTLPFQQHSEIPKSLGCSLNKQGYIEVDNTQKTTVDGVYACGDNSNFLRTLANAVYSGNKAGMNINAILSNDYF